MDKRKRLLKSRLWINIKKRRKANLFAYDKMMKNMDKLFTKKDLMWFDQYHNHAVEMRGVWHMPQTLNNFGYDERTLEGVIKLLDAIRDAGFNTILIETTMSARVVYPSNVATTHPDFIFTDNRYDIYGNDYLMCFLSEAHKRGLRVHAWTSTMRAGRFENNLASSLPQAMKEEWLSRGFHDEYGLKGKYGELMWMDPTNSEVVGYLLAQYEELVMKYPIDGVELDAIRYPISNLLKATTAEEISDFGYTPTAIEAFKKRYHFVGDFKQAIVAERAIRLDWIRFRVLVMTELVDKIRQLVLRLKPNMLFSAAVLMGTENAYAIACQDWATWVKNGWFDFISPMAYSIDDNQVLQSFLETNNLAQEKTLNLHGIASIIEGGDYQSHFRQMDLINAQGGLGCILFSIRQLLKDEKTHAMVSYVYNLYPAISPLESLVDIHQHLFKNLKEIPLSKKIDSIRNRFCTFTSIENDDVHIMLDDMNTLIEYISDSIMLKHLHIFKMIVSSRKSIK